MQFNSFKECVEAIKNLKNVKKVKIKNGFKVDLLRLQVSFMGKTHILQLGVLDLLFLAYKVSLVSFDTK